MMNKKILEKIIIALLLSIAFLFVAFNIYSVESYKTEQRRLEEEQDRIEKLEEELREQRDKLRAKRLDELKKDREKKIAEIIDFHEEFIIIKESFELKVKELSEKQDNKFKNIEELKELINDRIEANKSYKESFETINYIPEILNYFYEYELDFLEKDLQYCTELYEYYENEDYSNYNLKRIKDLQNQSLELSKKANTELLKIYRKYDLRDLFKELYNSNRNSDSSDM